MTKWKGEPSSLGDADDLQANTKETRGIVTVALTGRAIDNHWLPRTFLNAPYCAG